MRQRQTYEDHQEELNTFKRYGASEVEIMLLKKLQEIETDLFDTYRMAEEVSNHFS